jgi:hypothetical protein
MHSTSLPDETPASLGHSEGVAEREEMEILLMRCGDFKDLCKRSPLPPCLTSTAMVLPVCTGLVAVPVATNALRAPGELPGERTDMVSECAVLEAELAVSGSPRDELDDAL